MNYRYLLSGLTLVVLLATISSAQAGAGDLPEGEDEPTPTFRVCISGPSRGVPCSRDEQCSKSKCVLDFARIPAIKGTLTIIVDDNVSDEFGFGDDTAPDVVAVTILLEFKKNGTPHFLAQTYQNLNGKDLDEFIQNLQEGPVFLGMGTEQKLNDAENDLILNRLLAAHLPLSLPHAFCDIASALREEFSTIGTPIVWRARFPHRSDYGADILASVFHAQVEIRFVRDPLLC